MEVPLTVTAFAVLRAPRASVPMPDLTSPAIVAPEDTPDDEVSV
jgi:hypothetical protein